MNTGKQAKKRKTLLRRPAAQVELALPPPPGATEFVPLEPQWWWKLEPPAAPARGKSGTGSER